MNKIVFIATSAYTVFNEKAPGSHGGMELQLSLIAKEFANRKDFESVFFVGNYGQKKTEYKNKVRLVRTTNPKAKSNILIKGIQASRYFFSLMGENPDYVFTSSANSIVGIAAFYSKLFRKIHIHRCANIIDTNKVWINKNSFLGKVYKYGLENATHVLCQTEDQKLELVKNHGISGTLFRNVFEFDKKKKVKKDGSVLWVGRAVDYKGPKKALEIAKKNPHIKFIMICNKQSDLKYYNEIESEANKLDNMEFFERVAFSKIQEYYDKASLYLSTSDNEGFANTYIQSGIGGTPIVSLNANPDDFLNVYNCGYHANGNIDKVSKEINKILDNKKVFNVYSKNIHEYVRSKYDIKENMKVIFDLVDKKEN